jgi:DNA repair protein RadC
MLNIDSIEFENEKRDGCRLKNYIKKPEDAVEIFVNVLKMDAKEEVVAMMALDNTNRLIGVVELMRGGDALEKIGTDDLFYLALRLEAHSIILGYTKSDKSEVDNYDYEFYKFLLKETEKFRINVKYFIKIKGD